LNSQKCSGKLLLFIVLLLKHPTLWSEPSKTIADGYKKFC